MARSNYPYLAREGWYILLIFLVLTFFIQIMFGGIVPVLLLLIIFLFIWLIRDPKPNIPPKPLAVLSPVDGEVLAVEKAQDPLLERSAIRISLHMKWWNVYSLRNVIEGKVMNQWSISSQENGNQSAFAWWVQTDEGDDVLTVVHTSQFSRRYRFYVQTGERLGHGHRCGFVFFGTTVEVWIPEDSRIHTELKQSLRSGETVLSEFIHTEAVTAVK